MTSLRRPMTYAARTLRKGMTLPEVMLWQRLRGGQAGAKFRRQHPIESVIVDFYCREVALVVEIDGIVHDMGNRPVRDCKRDAMMQNKGLDVLRIAASDVLKDVDAVADSVRQLVLGRLASRADKNPLRPFQGHLPVSGRIHS
jgi:very-short-patch-repair endonuclease